LISRTTRTKTQVLSNDTWGWLESLNKELTGTKHLIVLNPIPVIFGNLDPVQSVLEKVSQANGNLGTTRWHKFLRRLLHLMTGGKDQWRFAEPQLLDDCLDRWSAHREERFRLLTLFWTWSRQGTRVTLLSGDVHCAAIGMCQHDDGRPIAGPRIRGLWTARRDRETRTTVDELHRELHDVQAMFQIVSSAIGNEPPPNWVRWLSEMTDGRLAPPNIHGLNHIAGRFANDDVDYKEGMLTFGTIEQRERAVHNPSSNHGLGLIHAKHDHGKQASSFSYQSEEATIHPALYAINRPMYQIIRIVKRNTGRRVMRRRNWAEISVHEICGECLDTQDAEWIRLTLHCEKLSNLRRMLEHKHDPRKSDTGNPEERKWEIWIPALLL
jgi:hypothetical protein